MRVLSVPSWLERRLPAGRTAGIVPAFVSCRGRLEASDTAAWKAAFLRLATFRGRA